MALQNPRTTISGYVIFAGFLLLGGGFLLSGCDPAIVATGTCDATLALPEPLAGIMKTLGAIGFGGGVLSLGHGAKDGTP